MHSNFVTVANNHPIVSSIWQMTIDSENTPYSSPIISFGKTFIVYNFNNEPFKLNINNNSYNMNGLSICFQNYGFIEINYFKKSYDLGVIMHPTAFYKMFKINMSTLTNQIVKLENINKELSLKLSRIFIEHKFDMVEFKSQIVKFFDEYPLYEDKKTLKIDEIIKIIEEKEGKITLPQVLDFAKISRRTLENHFNKIVGITPAKYIRKIKFTSIIRKYQNNEIDLDKMIKDFQFYDASHLNKEFRLFTGQTPKQFFGAKYPLIKNLLSK